MYAERSPPSCRIMTKQAARSHLRGLDGPVASSGARLIGPPLGRSRPASTTRPAATARTGSPQVEAKSIPLWTRLPSVAVRAHHAADDARRAVERAAQRELAVASARLGQRAAVVLDACAVAR